MSFLHPLWSFLSVVVIAWTTQRIISYWDRRKKIEETKLSIFLSWMPFLAECYARAAYPDGQPYDAREFLKKKMELLGTLQIMGPSHAIDAVLKFCGMAELGFMKDPLFDGEIFHRCYTHLNCCLCCEIHGEKYDDCAPNQSQEPTGDPSKTSTTAAPTSVARTSHVVVTGGSAPSR